MMQSMTKTAGLALLAAACSAPPLPPPAQPLVPTPDAPFRKARPARSAESGQASHAVPSVESATLSNGLSVWVATRTGLPYVALTLVSRDAGTSSGVAPAERLRLTLRAVAEGGTVWDDQRIVEPPRLNGQGVDAEVAPTYGAFTLRALSGSLDPAVMLLGRTVRAPALGRGNLDEVRLNELKRMQNVSSGVRHALLEMALDAALGSELASPYLNRDMDEVRRSPVAAIERCYREALRPETSALIAVGDVTLAELVPLVERDLGTWRASSPPLLHPSLRAPRYLSRATTIHFLPQNDSGQAEVLLLQPAPLGKAEADELPYLLMAEIAVGSVRSRANLSLRHAAGITYGLEPFIWSTPELGLLQIAASFERGEAASAIAELRGTLKTLQAEPVTEAELQLAKAAILADLERDVSKNQSLAQHLALAFARGSSESWLASRPAAIAAVTPADIQRVARAYLRPDEVEIAVAGAPALARDLEELGEVEVYSVRRSQLGDRPRD